jgi:S-adenosylmethionine decarboxylase
MTGREWVIEAYGCDSRLLADLNHLKALFAQVIEGLALRPVGETLWHQFPGPAGITGLCLLAESHLTCHTFPEHRSLCLNLFCCRPRPEWDFVRCLKERFAAERVSVRCLVRSYCDEPANRHLPELRGANPVSLVEFRSDNV